MRICLITYEYPPDTGIGGIATYMYQLSKSFEQTGIPVEVICASPHSDETTIHSDYLTVTKIKCDSTETFRKVVPGIAAQRHLLRPFDIIECPEFGAIGLYIKSTLPGIPLVIKLHTPKFLIKEINDYYYDKRWWRKLKKNTGFTYHYKKDPEYQALLQADHITSPSLSLKKITEERWKIAPGKITHIPNPYTPSRDLLGIAPGAVSKTVLYIGRLETRKGVFNLAKAIPLVVKQVPDARFIFLGKDSRGPLRERSMKQVMIRQVGEAINNVSFTDHVPLAEVPGHIAKAAVCVFPSLWENFPNVCLEAMAAARNIVAGKYGGMSDMLEPAGKQQLTDPHNVQAIAERIIYLLQQEENRETAAANRNRVINEYGDKIIEQTLSLYQSLIKK